MAGRWRGREAAGSPEVTSPSGGRDAENAPSPGAADRTPGGGEAGEDAGRCSVRGKDGVEQDVGCAGSREKRRDEIWNGMVQGGMGDQQNDLHLHERDTRTKQVYIYW